MDERTDWARSRPHEPGEPPPHFEGWRRESEYRSEPPRAGAPGGPRIPDLSALLAIVDALRRVVPQELQEMEVVLRDLDRGLVDFPSIRDGEEVFLCWEEGEDEIGFWHELEAGYGGRRPL